MTRNIAITSGRGYGRRFGGSHGKRHERPRRRQGVDSIFLKHKRRGRDQGAIIKIMERKETRFIGVVERSDRYAFIATDSKKMPFDIFVPLRDLQDAEDGEKFSWR